MRPFTLLRCTLGLCLAALCTGCASYNTISAAKPGSPKIYSGTRLDLQTAQGNYDAAKKFHATAPEHPLLDLPFSLLLDTVALPLTFSVSGYEAIFGAD